MLHSLRLAPQYLANTTIRTIHVDGCADACHLFPQSRSISRSNVVEVKEGIKYNSIESSELLCR